MFSFYSVLPAPYEHASRKCTVPAVRRRSIYKGTLDAFSLELKLRWISIGFSFLS